LPVAWCAAARAGARRTTGLVRAGAKKKLSEMVMRVRRVAQELAVR